MEDIIKEVEKEYKKKDIPEFWPGDEIAVQIKVVEGEKERKQVFSGTVIKRGGKGIGKTFTVRKVSYGEGVERIFPLYSPFIEKISLLKKGKRNRAKFYYLGAE